MPPFQLYVGDELVYESDEPAEEVVGIRLHTARGEVARINSPLDESKVMVTLDRRSSIMSNYLDLEEARVRREAAERRENLSDARADREGNQPSDEEMGIGLDPEEVGPAVAKRIDEERSESSVTPLAEEAAQPSFRPGASEPSGKLVRDAGVGDPPFEGARPVTVGEVEHPDFVGSQALTGQGGSVDQGTGTPAGDAAGPPADDGLTLTGPDAAASAEASAEAEGKRPEK